MTQSSPRRERLRALPAVQRLLAHPSGQALTARYGHALASEALAWAQEQARRRILAGAGSAAQAAAEADADADSEEPTPEALIEAARRRLEDLYRPRLRPVINATGVVIHTNLGRARLPAAAAAAVAAVATRASSLEYDLATGTRGSRQAPLERLIVRLTGAEAGMAVNNNAAAVLLALSAVAAGREVIVSRGELVEIGGSFRVPDVMAQSGARLVEVGTTNRTRLEDYRRAIGPDTAALLKVHTSNYRIVGFSEAPSIGELAGLAAQHGLPLIYDLGSGVLVDLSRWGLNGEPTVQGAVAAGASLVTFSGDKLLGGPQAGIIAGRRPLVEACARHPLARALRIDKLTAAALEATLTLYLDESRAIAEIPTLRMLLAPVDLLRRRAEGLCRRLAAGAATAAVEVVEVPSAPGGGALPGVELPSAAVAVRPEAASAGLLAEVLRAGDPPVVGRLERDRLLLDVRTVEPGEEDELVDALLAALARLAG
ncbi:MAG TPA: L-seryl-tRNA(Sec) selenium transferase [Bacillota bacterium]